jgi:WD40 repeat protein
MTVGIHIRNCYYARAIRTWSPVWSSSTKTSLASTGYDSTMRFWDLRSGKEIRRIRKADDYGVNALLSWGPKPKLTFALSPDGRTLASIGPYSITLQALDGSGRLLKLKRHQGATRSLTFDQSGETLLSLPSRAYSYRGKRIYVFVVKPFTSNDRRTLKLRIACYKIRYGKDLHPLLLSKTSSA